MSVVAIFVTAGDEDEARKIAQVLLDERKAACVNIVPTVFSSYWWQGRKEEAMESLLIVKTRESLVDDVVELVKRNHSYSVPEVIALPVAGGNADYLKWVQDETR